MADTPDDSPQRPTPPRSSKAAPPFLGPRKADGSEITEPRARQRRSSGLFVPPGALPPEEKDLPPTVETPIATRPPAADESVAAASAMTPVAPIRAIVPDPPVGSVAPPDDMPGAESTLRLSGYFELENLETPAISLKAERDRPAVGGSELQVIEYADANSGLASATPPGGRPSLDGLELESTELTIELSQEASRERGHAPSDLNIESFWAGDAFTPTARPTREISKALPPISRESTAKPAEPAALVPAVEAVKAVEPRATSEAPESRNSALDALRVEEVLPPRSPTPPSVRAVTPHNSTPAFSKPPAMRTPAALEALKELEPWAVSAMERPEIAAAIAFELERVARRIRNGELRVRTDVTAPNEESALSAALQAISRSSRH